ncbi:MAG: alpha/beta hydrolase [Bacteroidales bacterium]|nr:alpha/beta hydrolase [Bacteroidales bacterium]
MKKLSRLICKALLCVEMVSLVIMVGTCASHPADKAKEKQAEVTHASDAVHLTEKHIDFSCLDTAHYYFGYVNNNAYYYKINRLTEQGVSGNYYPVDSASQWLVPVPFSLKLEGGDLYFISKGVRTMLDIDIVVDARSISGSFSDKSELITKNKGHLVFQRYKEPSFHAYKSNRYNSETYEIEVEKDVKYGHAKGFWTSYIIKDSKYLKMLLSNLGKTITPKELDLKVDIYMPKDTFQEHPLFVLLHGGAFYFGDKGAETSRVWCEHFAKMGYVVASANYRMGFLPTKAAIQRCGYEAIQDANAVMRFLIHNAQQYGIDTNNVFVGGTSAGSIIMLSMAFMTDSNCPDFVRERNFKKKLGSLKTSGNDIRQPFKIKAIANMWGALYDLDEISSRPVPIISFHGDQDNVVPFDYGIPFSDVKGKIGERLFDTMYGSKSIHERLDSLLVRNEFYPLQGKKHAPYEDANGHVNDLYFFIQNKIQAFFLKELQRVAPIKQVSKKPLRYAVNQKDVEEIQWKVVGGFILERNEDEITVMWRQDAPRHVIYASGKLKNGTPFNLQKKISKPRHI